VTTAAGDQEHAQIVAPVVTFIEPQERKVSVVDGSRNRTSSQSGGGTGSRRASRVTEIRPSFRFALTTLSA